MNQYTPCKQCERPMRRYDETVTDHPTTVPPGARGLCVTCYQRAPEGKPRRETKPKNPVNVPDPHVLAVESGEPLLTFVFLPKPVYPRQFPVECRLCEWDRTAITAVAARGLAYKHFNSFMKDDF